MPGLGTTKYVQLAATVELGCRQLAERWQRGGARLQLGCTRLSHQLLARPAVRGFACLLLDNRRRVLAFEELFRGTLNGTVVYPREVVRRALAHNAAAAILVHNHYPGVAEPKPGR